MNNGTPSGRLHHLVREIQWPEVDPFTVSSVRPGDVVVVSAGFEERAVALLKALQKARTPKLTVIAFEYKPELAQNKYEWLAATCHDMGWAHVRITYDRCDPAGAFHLVTSSLPAGYSGPVYIDISGMSRLLIVQLIAGFFERAVNSIHPVIVYTEASEYPPTREAANLAINSQGLDAETALSFISAGVHEIAVVPELASINLHREPVRLITFPSFNPSQLLALRSTVQPSHITLIHGSPPAKELAWRKEAICRLNQVDPTLESDSKHASTLDYRETLDILLSLYQRWSPFNSLVISPTGSKMQSVAVGVFRGLLPDVQIVYPTPLRFTDPESHTRGSKPFIALHIDHFLELHVSSREEAGPDD